MLASVKREPVEEAKVKDVQSLTEKMEKGLRRRVTTQSQLASDLYGRNFVAYTQKLESQKAKETRQVQPLNITQAVASEFLLPIPLQ